MFFYNEEEAPSLSYSVSPSSLSFSSQGESKTSTFSVTNGPHTGGISLSSDNADFSVSPTSVAGDVTSQVITVTFNGSDNTQTGTISVLDSNSNVLATISVDSAAYVAPPPLSYSVSPSFLSFTYQGESLTSTFSVTNGPLTGGISISSDNFDFSVSPSSVAGDVTSQVITVTFNGFDNMAMGTISILDSSNNLLESISVDSSGYAGGGGGDGGDPFDPGGGAPPP